MAFLLHLRRPAQSLVHVCTRPSGDRPFGAGVRMPWSTLTLARQEKVANGRLRRLQRVLFAGRSIRGVLVLRRILAW